VARDEKKAIEWFEKAAAQGNQEARTNLDAIKASGK
jgi:TPR repeat protein